MEYKEGMRSNGLKRRKSEEEDGRSKSDEEKE